MKVQYSNYTTIYESCLRTGNLHKKSCFEGDFYFLKSSDAVVSVVPTTVREKKMKICPKETFLVLFVLDWIHL